VFAARDKEETFDASKRRSERFLFIIVEETDNHARLRTVRELGRMAG